MERATWTLSGLDEAVGTEQADEVFEAANAGIRTDLMGTPALLSGRPTETRCPVLVSAMLTDCGFFFSASTRSLPVLIGESARTMAVIGSV